MVVELILAGKRFLGGDKNEGETVSLAITRKKDFSRISNPGVPIFLKIILPSEKQKLQKFKRLVLVEFRMLFAEQFFLHFSHAVPGEFGNRQDPFGKFERCELRAQMLQDELSLIHI